MSLSAHQLHYRVNGRSLLSAVSLELRAGEVHAVLGPNGAGKSTLLRLLAREISPDAGEIRYGNRPLREWPGAVLARNRAVMSQRDQLLFAFTSAEVVGLGRLPYPHVMVAENEHIVDAALKLVDADHLRSRHYPSLSGGERARVQLARALAQIWDASEGQTRCLLLDEPTASQDLAHQHRCLGIARAFAARGVAVLAVLHDPNLVLAYADQVTVLCCGETLAQGAPSQVLTAELMSRIYGVPVRVLNDPLSGQRWIDVDSPDRRY